MPYRETGFASVEVSHQNSKMTKIVARIGGKTSIKIDSTKIRAAATLLEAS